MSIEQKVYRSVFRAGYIAVFAASFIPVAGNLSKIKIGSEAFKMQLDQILHFLGYFLICLYYFIGQKLNLSLFTGNSMIKFLALILILGFVSEIVQLWVP